MKKVKAEKTLTKEDLLKMEIAREMGIWDQVEKEGWGSMSNAVCGKVGGLMSKRLKEPKTSDTPDEK